MAFRSVLVTGANGFVGRRFVAALRRIEDVVLTLCGGPQAGRDDLGYHRLDLSDATAIDALVAETAPDLVIHLAGQASVSQADSASAVTWEVNFVGSFHLAQAIQRHTPNATMFFTSSADVYGAAFNDGVASEDGALKPQSVYAHTKAAAEAMLADVLPSEARLIIVRPSNHSGSGQDERFVLPSFARQIAEVEAGLRRPVMKVGNLDAERDFMHVDAVADTYLQLLSNASALPKRTVVNVASGRSIPIRALLDAMLRMTEMSIAVEVDSKRLRPSDVPSARLSIAQLRGFGIKPPNPVSDDLLREILDDQRAKTQQKVELDR